MSSIPTCVWVGASGRQYTYYVRQLPFNFNPNQEGNYIYSKINGQGLWVPIYIGEGDLADRVGPNHHQAACIKSKGATHVHAHINQSAHDRKAEESDLLARYTNAYKPSGCNEKIGG